MEKALHEKIMTKNLVRQGKEIFVNEQFKFLKTLTTYFPSILFYSVGGEFYIKVDPTQVWNLIFFLKNHSQSLYTQVIDISAIDSIERKNRFEVFYCLLSMTYNNRITVTTSIPEGVVLDSIVSIFPAANWYEREVWDMFGIFFKNHPDLRRILTDYGFKGHPLRKDFPMTGYVEVRYDDFSKRILYEEVSLTQEYRVFSLDNSWSDSNRNI